MNLGANIQYLRRQRKITQEQFAETMGVTRQYVMISPNPEDDVNAYMDRWSKNSGLWTAAPDSMRIGWDFPFVSPEQQNRFGLRGYASAYILPCLEHEFKKDGVTKSDAYSQFWKEDFHIRERAPHKERLFSFYARHCSRREMIFCFS